MSFCKSSLLLYAVSDRTWLNNDTLYEAVEKALKGGITLLQLREKDLDEESFIKEAIEIKKLTSLYNVPLIINDNVNVMLKSNADGIHIGQDDGDELKIRELIGPDKILGISIQNTDQLTPSVLENADYIGVGAIFNTSTKLDAQSVSLESLKDIVKKSKLPTCAIGGINLSNMDSLKYSGINGVALVSAIFDNEDIEASTKILKQKSKSLFFKNNVSHMIFDLDGTLLDSMGIWDDLSSKYLKSLGINDTSNIDNIVKSLSITNAASYMKEKYQLDKSIDEIIIGINNLIIEFYRDSVCLKDGVKEFIKKQYGDGIVLSIATATDKEITKLALTHNNILQYFSLIKTERDVKQSKAYGSKVYDSILDELNISKSDTLVFEDSMHCVKTLRENSYYIVGVKDEYCTEDIRPLCDYYIESFEDEL
jgi:thiamine-phosphate diphosphorylase